MGKINICTTHTYYAYEHISYIYYEKILSISDCGVGKYIHNIYSYKRQKKSIMGHFKQFFAQKAT